MNMRVQLLTLAPAYFTFGSQTITIDVSAIIEREINSQTQIPQGNTRICNLGDISDSTSCRMTHLAASYYRQVAGFPSFGIVLCLGNVVFFATLFLSCLVKMVRGRSRYEDDDHRVDHEENQGLL